MLKIIRVDSTDEETFGVLLIDGQVFCVTLELPWRDNKEDISCIPAGLYGCKRVKSPKHGMTFEVCGVFARTDILFHVGNRPTNTKGCILLGRTYNILSEDRAVLFSKRAVINFMERMTNIDECELEIVEV